MNCLLVINTMSGNASAVKAEEVIRRYAAGDLVTVKYLTDPSDVYSLDGVEKLIVCGGDGTLGNALNLCRERAIDLYYLPVGTFNETAKSHQGKGIVPLSHLGRLGDHVFSYVAAAGSFTEIGQRASAKTKKRYKLLAYFAEVLAAYKAHRIDLKIVTDRFTAKGTYTLVMLSNARRCFGFRFNRLHREDADELQLLLVKAPKRDDLWGRIRIFFPLFRAFFLGFGKEHFGKNLLFASVRSATLTLGKETPFCVDGERVRFGGVLPLAASSSHRARVYLIKE